MSEDTQKLIAEAVYNFRHALKAANVPVPSTMQFSAGSGDARAFRLAVLSTLPPGHEGVRDMITPASNKKWEGIIIEGVTFCWPK